MKTVIESSRKLPVSGEDNVIVAGGGIAGVAAAVAAARNGASVCLLEKNFGLGGLATLGIVTIWLPICDGRGRQVIAGLPEELLKLSVAELSKCYPAARFNMIPDCWLPGGDPEKRKSTRYRVDFNPASYQLALEKLVADSGIKILYDTRICDVVRNDREITHLVVENKSGRSAISCRTVIDATGDADICFMAGEETESLDGNVPAGWIYYLHENGLVLQQVSKPYDPNGGRKKGLEGPFFRGDNAEEVTAQLLESRRLIRKRLEEIRTKNPDSDIQIATLPSIPCFRMTRRLLGEYSLGEKDMHQWFGDTIGLTGDWRKSGPVYAVPWRTLHGIRNRNLLTAGRCISADTTVWDVTRAIPTCAMTGTAAGTAAVIANGNVHKLDVKELQSRLKSQGALIDPELVKPVP